MLFLRERAQNKQRDSCWRLSVRDQEEFEYQEERGTDTTQLMKKSSKSCSIRSRSRRRSRRRRSLFCWGRRVTSPMGVAEARDPGALEDMAKKEDCGRKLVVGMRLTASSREMLTWTIAKIARPGDHILALHVSTSPISGSSTTKTPLHCYFSLFMLSSSSSSSSVRGEHWHWVSSSYSPISIFFSKISNRGFCWKVLLRFVESLKSIKINNSFCCRKEKQKQQQTNKHPLVESYNNNFLSFLK